MPAPSAMTPKRELPRLDPAPVATAARSATSLAVKPAATTPTPPPDQPVAIADFEGLVAFAAEKRDIKLKTELERFVRPISVAPGKIEIALENGAPANLPGELSRKLEMWTNRRWMVTVARSGGETTISSRRKAEADSAMREALQREDVKTYLKAFPGAEVTKVREPEAPTLPEITQDETDEEYR
jgi:DNA polymerase-3 subunit gamma/tau